MNPRPMLLAAALAAGGLLFGSAAAHAQCGPAGGDEKGETTTLTASVVDQSCYLALGLHGEDHKMCAEVCAKAGVPLVFLTDDGQLVLPVSSAMPSSGFNERLVEHAEQDVEVTGKLVTKAGSRAIVVDKIEAAP